MSMALCGVDTPCSCVGVLKSCEYFLFGRTLVGLGVFFVLSVSKHHT